ncbi:RagB/SusD family nutrient uptake outer membrane protein [Hymenobacter sp. NBH84]|uniref:RagB/SusD family nutrient uptake outer membrane protein n=1 Tax=Hymenobacter sp. NBH84 TaxID=2596915 RepID=UPI00162AEEC8|nr:RagB/SusD family nutrient uptake outer membrane protein [Hymenobacter sp. NBH84]
MYPEPQNSLTAEQVFTDEAGANAALVGTFGALTSTNYLGNSYPVFSDMAADNLLWNGSFPTWSEIKNRSIIPSNVDNTNMYAAIYVAINRANNVIAYTPGIASISDANKAIIVAQARFVRAACYFDLTRYWGDVAIILTPTTTTGEVLNIARSPKTAVYDQIKQDLDAAEAALPDVSVGRGTKWAAKALKARLALYSQDWASAASLADEVIASGRFQLLTNYRNVWTTENSAESIWEVQMEAVGQRSFLAFYLLPVGGGRGEAITLGSTLAAAFETGDTRRNATISNGTATTATGVAIPAGNQFKYYQVSGDDNFRYIRYAEVLLIAAEAKARIGTPAALAASLGHLNQVRTRAGLPASTAATSTALLTAVAQERRVELALEGHRWFDLIRTGTAQSTLGITDANKLLFPIPLRELQNNPNMTQNPGY